MCIADSNELQKVFMWLGHLQTSLIPANLGSLIVGLQCPCGLDGGLREEVSLADKEWE